MALPPQKFREIVFQLLYAQDFSSLYTEETIPFMMNELKVTRRTMIEAHEKVAAILEKLAPIDERIAEASTSYSFDRISSVEKTILRLGCYELLFEPELPPKVAIAEAIRLCRKFGTHESAQFINAILDDTFKKMGGISGSELSNEPVTV